MKGVWLTAMGLENVRIASEESFNVSDMMKAR